MSLHHTAPYTTLMSQKIHNAITVQYNIDVINYIAVTMELNKKKERKICVIRWVEGRMI